MLFNTVWNIVKLSVTNIFYLTYYHCVFVLVEIDKPIGHSIHVGSRDNFQDLLQFFLPL